MKLSWKVGAIFAVLFTVAVSSTGHFAGDLLYYGARPPVAWTAAFGIEIGIAVAMWTVLERRAAHRPAGWVVLAVLLMSALSMLANGHHAQVQARAALGRALGSGEQWHVTALWAALPLLNVLLAGIADGERGQRAADGQAELKRIEQAVAEQTSAVAQRLSSEHEQATAALRARHEQLTAAQRADHEQAIAAQQTAHEQAMAAERAGHREQLSLLMSSPEQRPVSTSSGRVSTGGQPVSSDELLTDIDSWPKSSDADRAERLGCSRASVQRLRTELAGDERIIQDDRGRWSRRGAT